MNSGPLSLRMWPGAPRVPQLHAAELALPGVEGRLADVVLRAYGLDRALALRLPQRAYYLLLGESTSFHGSAAHLRAELQPRHVPFSGVRSERPSESCVSDAIVRISMAVHGCPFTYEDGVVRVEGIEPSNLWRGMT